MIAEFSALQERAAHLEQVKSTQVNFFLVVVAAVIAGVSSFSNNSNFQPYLPHTIFAASLLIFLLGFATLNQSVNYSMSIVSFYRRAGRIRRWFVNIDNNLAEYVAFPAGDDRPKFKLTRSYLAFRGGDAVLLTVNSVSFATIAASLMMNNLNFEPISVLIATIIFGIFAWLFQHRIVYRRLAIAEERDSRNIHFPHKKLLVETSMIKTSPSISDSDVQQVESP
jgi:hypothetical protein